MTSSTPSVEMLERAQRAGRPPAVVQVDLDGATDIYRTREWDVPRGRDRVFETGLPRFLRLFDAYNVRATFFVIGSSLDDPYKRELLQEAVRRGHEIASHSLTHRLLTRITEDEKRREIADGREQIERVLGVRVRGFRAPGFQIDSDCIRLLAENQFEYDASAFPTQQFIDCLGVPAEALELPGRPFPGNPLVELPLPDHRPFPIPFHPSYALILGLRYFRWGLMRGARRGRPLVLLFHLIDLADPLPRAQARRLSERVFTLSVRSRGYKWQRCQRMLEIVREHYRPTTTTALLAELDGHGHTTRPLGMTTPTVLPQQVTS
jgi:peptidoglycan/xylan/chitin deacetylase (PgdA/CDA1 family)